MKKSLTTLVVLLFVGLSVFSLGEQKIYSVDSQVYKDLCTVYLGCGKAMPSSTGPWSATELQLMYSRIKASEVPSYMTFVYERIEEELYSGPKTNLGDFGFNADIVANLFTYIHANSDSQFQGHEAFMANTRVPMVDFIMDFSYSDNVHFLFEPSFQNTEINNSLVGSTNFFTNIMMFQDPVNGGDFDMSMPNRAYAAFGGKNISFQIGRDRLSWGLGTTGNVTISNNMPRHDMARFTVFSDRFKFTYLIDVFPHKVNYYLEGDGSGVYDLQGTSHADSYALNGTSMYIGHRLEGRFLDDKLSITITEAMMYASLNNYLNLSIFNPAMLYHDLYIARNSNSSLAFEADYTPFRNFNIYAQFLIDDFAGPGEAKASDTTDGNPNAYALVLGATYLTPVYEGTLRLNGEFAKVNPYTYLRYSGNSLSKGETDIYGLDYVVAMRFYSMGAFGTNVPLYEEFVQGYTYGPDCIVGNLNATYTGNKNLDLSANAFFMAHGTHDIWTSWQRTGNEAGWVEDSATPSTKHLTVNRNDPNAQNRDAVEYTLDLGLAAEYRLLEKLTLSSQADLVCVWNSGNYSSSEFKADFQLMVGASYSFL